MVEYFIKHGELINQSPSVEMITAKNVNEIIYMLCIDSRGEQNRQLNVGCAQDYLQ